MKADLLVDSKCILGEGVQWNPDHARIWWTDIHGRGLWSCNADGGDVERIETRERLGCFAFDPDNRILAAFESGLFAWDIEGDRMERLTTFEPHHPKTRLNDGRCDRQGRLLTGGMNEDELKPVSSLIRYDGEVEELETGIGVTNSLCFSPDGRWMYFADTPTEYIRRYPYDPETGKLGTPEVFYRSPEKTGYPDGSCVDFTGALWNARFWGARVQRILPDGTEGEMIEVDAPQVTCACFGGPNLDRLYITTAREHFTEEQAEKYPLSGGLFVAEPGVKGLPEDRYAKRLFAG